MTYVNINGKSGVANGVGVTASELVDEIDHYCKYCGHWLLASTVPSGTMGMVRVRCPERMCHQYNAVKLGQRPLPRPSRSRWLNEKSAQRQNGRVGTQF